jgi:hypothetical protein
MQKFTGLQYLKLDIASNFGLDKKTWDERLDWFEAHKDCLHEMLATAETPALYFAGVKAYEAAMAREASGYPISLDATSSGFQILAALTGDRKAAELCNVVPTQIDGVTKRADAYTGVYNIMLERLAYDDQPAAVTLAEKAGHAKPKAPSKIKRDDCKTAIMTALYGSSAEPKRVFGEGNQLAVFYQVMEELAPAAWELNQAFLGMWDPEALINSWVLPDNFHVHVKVMAKITERVHFMDEPFDTERKINAPTEEGRSLGANTIHSLDGMIVREMARRCNYDMATVSRVWMALDGVGSIGEDADDQMVMTLWGHYKESGYLSARILDHLYVDNIDLVDESLIIELLNSLPQRPFEVISIHDCFRCLPNYGNDLREQYNLQLMLIAKSKLLQFLVRQILNRDDLKVAPLDADLWKEIADTEYALS